MNAAMLLLYVLNFTLIGLLPVIFFRADGRLGPMWWLTALPFFLCLGFLVAAFVVPLAPMVPQGWATVSELVSLPLGVFSIALIFMTLGTHRIPVALWHQDDDAPTHLVTYGAYGRIRHPFYAAFLLTFLGAFVLFPHWATLALLGYAVVVLNFTAAREERRLRASEFGSEYRRYMSRTGRFLPRLGAGSTNARREPTSASP